MLIALSKNGMERPKELGEDLTTHLKLPLTFGP
jgi:hypothetical protein